ncbi:hypothetical protein DA102_035645 [Sinorhizobium meliloti]|nr:hypothetical protein DA102_035645 [Sinorhizobium meliloti]
MRSARKAVHFGGSIHTRALVRIAEPISRTQPQLLPAHHHQAMIAELPKNDAAVMPGGIGAWT